MELVIGIRLGLVQAHDCKTADYLSVNVVAQFHRNGKPVVTHQSGGLEEIAALTNIVYRDEGLEEASPQSPIGIARGAMAINMEDRRVG
uniref:Uncharacterized protein n=1 Tax=Oryza brachyantha TaxID=4533 RepID=J3NF84_ORYBR